MTTLSEALAARDAAVARATAAEARVLVLEREARAREVISRQLLDCREELSSLAIRGLLADLPLTESGALDEPRLRSITVKAVAESGGYR